MHNSVVLAAALSVSCYVYMFLCVLSEAYKIQALLQFCLNMQRKNKYSDIYV